MTPQSRIPVLVCVDVEPDEPFVDRNSPLPWTGFEAAAAILRQIRARAARVTGAPVRFNWFLRMDPQIAETYGTAEWAAGRYAQTWREFEREGDELGLHAHAYRWIADAGYWLVDHGNQEWVENCISVSFEAYRRAFGRNCLSFRFGDRWLSNQTVALLERLGARFELTVEPGFAAALSLRAKGRPFTGSIPDYRRAPRAPYRPSLADFRVPDPARKAGLWMIPLSTAPAVHPYSRRRKLLLAFTRPSALRPVNLIPHFNLDPDFFPKVLDHHLRSARSAYLAIGARSDVFDRPGDAERVIRNFETFLNRPEAPRFVFTTPAGALEMLQSAAP